MLAGQFIDAALDRLAQAEIIAVKGQHLFVANGIEDPVRELDLAPQQAPVHAMLAPDRRGIDQAEAVDLLFVAADDIGPDPCAFQPVQRIHQRHVFPPAGAAIGKDQQLMRVDADPRRDDLAALELGHDLADAIDQDVLVIDRGQPLDAGGDLQPVVAVAVALDRGLGLLRQRIERMLHMLHHVLQHRIRHVADEQVVLGVAIGQKRRKRVRVFSYHGATFVFSVTAVKIRVFSYRNQDFSYRDSCFQLPALKVMTCFDNEKTLSKRA